jgi:hypothetical protein
LFLRRKRENEYAVRFPRGFEPVRKPEHRAAALWQPLRFCRMSAGSRSAPGFFPARATVKPPALNGTTALDLPHFGSSGGKVRRETARNGRSVTPDKPVRPENRGKGSAPRVCF